jgi:hypothetical protein
MKTFLTTCIVAMISAGVYGIIDLAKNISQDTYIQYEEDIADVKSNTASEKNIANVIRKARQEVSVTKEKKRRSEPRELNVELFSRSNPSMYLESIEDQLTVATDSVIKKRDTTSLAIVDPAEIVNAEATKQKPDSLVKKEEVKFDVSLFSRGRPRTARKVVAVAQNDTTSKP